jgi:acyl-coenzyme A synthetase/AMP-(fatty) acid ligase
VIATGKTATGLEIRDGYGQTETCCLVGNYKGLPVKPGSMGKPSPGYDIAIIDDDGQPVAAGKEGDIGVRTSRCARSVSSASTGRTTRRTGAACAAITT